MKVTVLASGSKGNCTLVETKNHNILIDVGISYLNIKKRLNKDLPSIDIIIITHLHDDHISGLNSFIKKYKPTIYTKCEKIIEHTTYNNIYIQDEVFLEDLIISLFPVSHDTKCYGIIIGENERELVYITDTGYVSENNLNKIKNKDIYILESNHDEDMLRHGSYPWYLQQRIRGVKGHLSNDLACSYVKQIIGNKTRSLILAHLSEENNTKELAEITMKNTLKEMSHKTKLYIADQDEVLETIEV